MCTCIELLVDSPPDMYSWEFLWNHLSHYANRDATIWTSLFRVRWNYVCYVEINF